MRDYSFVKLSNYNFVTMYTITFLNSIELYNILVIVRAMMIELCQSLFCLFCVFTMNQEQLVHLVLLRQSNLF